MPLLGIADSTHPASDAAAKAELEAEGYVLDNIKAAADVTDADVAACTGVVVFYSAATSSLLDNPALGGAGGPDKPLFTMSRANTWITYLQISSTGSQVSGVKNIYVTAAGADPLGVSTGTYDVLSSTGTLQHLRDNLAPGLIRYSQSSSSSSTVNQVHHGIVPAGGTLNDSSVTSNPIGYAFWVGDTDAPKILPALGLYMRAVARQVLGDPADHLPPEPTAPTSLSVRALVTDYETAASGSGSYTTPTAADLTGMAAVWSDVKAGRLAEANTAAAAYGYAVTEVTDTETGRRFAALQETGAKTRWWGLYLWSLEAAPAAYVIAQTHTGADLNTEHQAAEILLNSNARALLATGTHRDASATLDADGDNITDVANVSAPPSSVLQAILEATVVAADTVIEPHGFVSAEPMGSAHFVGDRFVVFEAATTATIGLPTGAAFGNRAARAGDRTLVQLTLRGDYSWTATEPGWTELTTTLEGTSIKTVVLTRELAQADIDRGSFTFGGWPSSKGSITLVSYESCDVVQPIGGAVGRIEESSTTVADHQTPPLTTAVDDCILVMFMTCTNATKWADSASFSNGTTTISAKRRTAADTTTSGSSSTSLFDTDNMPVAAGTWTGTATNPTASGLGGFALVALRPKEPARTTEIILSQGDFPNGGDPGQHIIDARDALTALGYNTVANDGTWAYTAAGNVQGIYTRSVGAQFLHCEQVFAIRSDASRRDEVAAALTAPAVVASNIILDHRFSGPTGSTFEGDAAYANILSAKPTYVRAPLDKGLRFDGNVQTIIQHVYDPPPSASDALTIDRVYRLASPTTALCEVSQVRNGATRGPAVAFTADNRLRLLRLSTASGSPVGESVATTQTPLPVGSLFRVQWVIDGANLTARLFASLDATESVETLTSTTSEPVTPTAVRDGIITATGLGDTSLDVFYPRDSVGGTPEPRVWTALPEEAPRALAPAVSPQEPWATGVELIGSYVAETNPVATAEWTPAPGNFAVLDPGSGPRRTFTTPASLDAVDLEFILTVTDIEGLSSTASTTVPVLPATYASRTSDGWVPHRRTVVTQAAATGVLTSPNLTTSTSLTTGA